LERYRFEEIEPHQKVNDTAFTLKGAQL
jgi:hypothetical protein